VTSRSRPSPRASCSASTRRRRRGTVQARTRRGRIPSCPRQAEPLAERVSSVARGSSASRWSRHDAELPSVPVDIPPLSEPFTDDAGLPSIGAAVASDNAGNGEECDSAGEFGVAFKGFLDQAQRTLRLRSLSSLVGSMSTLAVIRANCPRRQAFRRATSQTSNGALDTFLASNDRRLTCRRREHRTSGSTALAWPISSPNRSEWLDGSNAPGPGPVEYVDVALGDTDAINLHEVGLDSSCGRERPAPRCAYELVRETESNHGQINVEAMARTERRRGVPS